jgi:hypothetical protein
MTYQFAIGWDNEGSLADIPQQPKTDGITYPEYRDCGDGSIQPNGKPRTTLIYDEGMRKSVKNELFTFLGFVSDSVFVVEGTARLLNHDRLTFANYNVKLICKHGVDTKFLHGLWRSIEIKVVIYEAL